MLKDNVNNSQQPTANSQYRPVLEESLKNKVARIYFDNFDCTDILGKIDFCVAKSTDQESLFFEKEREYYLWAEAKKDKQKDINKLFVQLILTIGKDNKLRNEIPPKFLGAFTPEEIAFIPYADIQEIFIQNDFNWNVPASKYDTKEFKQLYSLVEDTLNKKKTIFKFTDDEKHLKSFIKKNFKKGKTDIAQIEVNKSNFAAVYTRWLKEVKDTIGIDWTFAKSKGILDADFYLADLLSSKNQTVKDNLFVLLKNDHYEYNRKKTELGVQSLSVQFNDKQKAHSSFWLKYKRPPASKYQEYIILRKDLLVPQDIRERKGSYFTPQMWVEKSQEYLASVLGDNWQEEYYIWDCCAGTGNMEVGLTNKFNVWASTIDQADVDIMIERAKNGTHLLESHIFQMDFLNDEFEKKDGFPKDLLAILKDPEKRKKLIIYINPPYGEPTSSKTISNRENRHKKSVSESKVKEKYQDKLKQGAKELFIQFLARCYFEIPEAFIGNFSTIKALQGKHYKEFRDVFLAKIEKLFIVPADTFDNVSGQFPIGFFIWNTQKKEKFSHIIADVFDNKNNFLGVKRIENPPDKNIKNWLGKYRDDNNNSIAYLTRGSSDVQNNNIVHITLNPSQSVKKAGNTSHITAENLIVNVVFFSVRKSIPHIWMNDRDQFLYPKEEWKTDKEFQADCLAFTLFHDSNVVKSQEGANHWIPFTEQEVSPRNNFESHFMTDYIKEHQIQFSREAQGVLEAGKALWKYYHSQPDSNPNASFYDIKEYFKGRNDKGTMNKKSEDENYNVLIWDLEQTMKTLQKKIAPKVYEHGFLLS